MKHQTLDQLHRVADVESLVTYPIMTRNQRIERWAELLEQHPNRCLEALAGTEYLDSVPRDKARGEGLPVTVAFEDSVLRALGQQNDTCGEAKRFFELTDWQLHNIVCDCHVGCNDASAMGRFARPCGNSWEFQVLCLAERKNDALKQQTERRCNPSVGS